MKYQCPQQFCFGGDGVHIADGSTVIDSSLYDIHIRGHDGTIISELLIKKPHEEASEGIYQCEVSFLANFAAIVVCDQVFVREVSCRA